MQDTLERSPEKSELRFSRPADDILVVGLSGDWRFGQELPSADDVVGSILSVVQGGDA